MTKQLNSASNLIISIFLKRIPCILGTFHPARIKSPSNETYRTNSFPSLSPKQTVCPFLNKNNNNGFLVNLFFVTFKTGLRVYKLN